MTESVRPLLPLATSGQGLSRTGSDRLELLTVLMAAPSCDPLFTAEVICIPRDHAVYGWGCNISNCERSQESSRSFCAHHEAAWRKQRQNGGLLADFRRTAEPLTANLQYRHEDCAICPGIPARGATMRLCYVHGERWQSRQTRVKQERGQVSDLDYEQWLATQTSFPPYGSCRVRACADRAEHPLSLCLPHLRRYHRDGSPGQARLPGTGGSWAWTRRPRDPDQPIGVLFDDELAFQKWCAKAHALHRNDGKLSLLGLRPLVRAEIQWCLFQRTQVTVDHAHWPLTWIQQLADVCRDRAVDSLADLDIDQMKYCPVVVANGMLRMLRLVYFTREDTKDAYYIETEHFESSSPATAGRSS